MRNPYKLTFKQLMLSNVYLGSRKESFNLMIKSFVLGYRGNFLILNLSYTYLQFRLLTYLIINFVLVHKKLLIVKELDPFNLKISLKSKNIFFYDKKWIGGVLTNYKIVSQCDKFFRYSETFLRLREMRHLPALIFLFDPNISSWALFEASTLGIQTSAIVNTDCMYLQVLNYPIVGNTESFEAMYLYLHIIKNAVKIGRSKERLKILNLKIKNQKSYNVL